MSWPSLCLYLFSTLFVVDALVLRACELSVPTVCEVTGGCSLGAYGDGKGQSVPGCSKEGLPLLN